MFVYFRLSNGSVVPYLNWTTLERDGADAFGCTTFDLYKEVAWRYGRMPVGAGELANWGMAVGLWRLEYRPMLCEFRYRRWPSLPPSPADEDE
jgi:hypothetical protein